MNRVLAVRVALVLAIAVMPLPVAAQQTTPYAFVIYAEGYDLSIFRNGELQTWDVLVDDVIGMPLLAGDLVQTDAQTFVEIQLMPTRTVVKVAENTTFEIERLGGDGGGSFNMTYGRVRARVERISRDDSFQIRGFSAVAGVRGTDFGYDMVVERELTAELQTRVYVFEGEVEVSSREDQETQVAEEGMETPARPEPVRLTSNQMVSVITEAPVQARPEVDLQEVPSVQPPPKAVTFRQQEMESQIQEFWSRQDFREEPVDPEMVDERFPGINARVQQLTDERRQFEELQRLRREGMLGGSDAPQLAAIEELPERPPEREPTSLTLGPSDGTEQVRRLITPDTGPTRGQQLRTAGNWLVGAGIALELVGLGIAYFDDNVRTASDLSGSGPVAGFMLGGGVFLSSSVIAYLLSLVVD